MSLLWIVPGRRAVVSDRASYADVVAAWVAELRDAPVREAMLRWYSPMARFPDRFEEAYDRGAERIEGWASGFFEDTDRSHTHAAAPGMQANIARDGYWTRLWKGPYRVLKEHEAGHGYDPEAEAIPRGVLEVDGGGPLRLRMDGDRRVMNYDADFVPGDVIEMPVFHLLWRCGVRGFEGAHFRADGSYLLGTSVAGGPGRPTPRLHDNLLGMRLQALRGLARGAFYSLTPGYTGEDDLLRKSNSGEVCGETVHARGIVYGGTLPTGAGPSGAYSFHDLGWGKETGLNLPNAGALDQFRPDTRLTTAWSCTPMAAVVAKTLTGGTRGLSGVGRVARSADVPSSWEQGATLHYVHPRMMGAGNSAEECLAAAFARAGGRGAPDLGWLRAQGLNQLLGPSLYEVHATERAAARARAAAQEADDDVLRFMAQRRGTADPLAMLEREHCEDDDGSDDEPHPHDTPLDAHRVEWNAEHWHREFDGGENNFALGREEMLTAFARQLHVISLSSHEYCYVRILKHAKLLERNGPDDENGNPTPPVAGFLAAFNPLNGQDDYAAPDDRGDFFVFEATGRKHPTKLMPDPDRRDELNFNVFEVRPARWTRVEQIRFRTKGETVYIGDAGAVNTTRAKHLLSVVSFGDEALECPHRYGEVVRPLTLQSRANALHTKTLAHDYPVRALPFPTLDESSVDEQFATLDEARGRGRLLGAQLNETLNLETYRLNEFLRERLIGYHAKVRRARRELDADVQRAGVRAGGLRRRLARNYPPSGGETSETLVEERALFRTAVPTLQRQLVELRRRAERAAEQATTADTTWRQARIARGENFTPQSRQAVNDALEARTAARAASSVAAQELHRQDTRPELALLEAVSVWEGAQQLASVNADEPDAPLPPEELHVFTVEKRRLSAVVDLLPS